MTRPVRTLLFSSLYPNAKRPLLGIFVETRLRELLATGMVQTKVVAPIPWFPFAGERFGKFGKMAEAPKREWLNGIDVLHPRFVVLPKVGMSLAPWLLAAGAVGAVSRLLEEGFDFDVIDAHYYYPDGVAAALLAAWFRKPLVITARGTDVNVLPNYRLPRLMIQWAARQARASIGVSAALVERMCELHMDPQRLHVMRNGVDATRFSPRPMRAARHALGLDGAPLLLTVGNLQEHKGQRLVIESLARLRHRHPRASLVIIGDGPDRGPLEQLATTLGLEDGVKFAGQVANADLAQWYSAADVLVLASSREGWPNVLLEAMACGTPVVASRVGGIPEAVQGGDVGRLVVERSPDAFAAAIQDLLEAAPDRERVRGYAEGFSWHRTSLQQLQLFQTLVAQS